MFHRWRYIPSQSDSHNESELKIIYDPNFAINSEWWGLQIISANLLYCICLHFVQNILWLELQTFFAPSPHIYFIALCSFAQFVYFAHFVQGSIWWLVPLWFYCLLNCGVLYSGFSNWSAQYISISMSEMIAMEAYEGSLFPLWCFCVSVCIDRCT